MTEAEMVDALVAEMVEDLIALRDRLTDHRDRDLLAQIANALNGDV